MENQQQAQYSSYPQVVAAAPSSSSFHQLLQQQHQQLQMFWNYQRQEIEHASDFKNHQLPLARIKKIMKADEDVRMISAEAPILFAKACELFILELTIRSWLHAEENKRRTLQKNDIAAAITRTDIFDFLVDIVPREEAKEEGMGGLLAAGGMVAAEGAGAVGSGGAAHGVPYYYPPMVQPGTGMIMGQPAMAGAGHAWQQPLWQQGLPEEDGSYDGGHSLEGPSYVPTPTHPPPQTPPPPGS